MIFPQINKRILATAVKKPTLPYHHAYLPSGPRGHIPVLLEMRLLCAHQQTPLAMMVR